jgi:hypothetical protein
MPNLKGSIGEPSRIRWAVMHAAAMAPCDVACSTIAQHAQRFVPDMSAQRIAAGLSFRDGPY